MTIIWDIEEHYMMMSINQESRATLNLKVLPDKTSKYMKYKLIQVKGEINKVSPNYDQSIIISVSIINKKISKHIKDPRNSVNETGLLTVIEDQQNTYSFQKHMKHIPRWLCVRLKNKLQKINMN